MDLARQLHLLQAAQGHPAKLALATVDLAFPAHSDDERAELKEALQAAAIPHWCDASILSILLDISQADSVARFSQLRRLTVVEMFPARGDGVLNVHEATRLALRELLAAEAQPSFQRM